MAQFYNLTEYKPYREPWHTDNGSFQTYFGKLEGVEQSVMINKKVGNAPQLGWLYGSLEVKPGKDWFKFNAEQKPEGVQPPAGGATPAAQPAAAPQAVGTGVPGWAVPFINQLGEVAKQVAYIHGEMKKMDSDTPVPEAPKAHELSESEVAQVADMFGEPEPDEAPKV